MTEETKLQQNTKPDPDLREAAMPPSDASIETTDADVDYWDDTWRGHAAAFGAKGDGIADVNNMPSIWLALEPALFSAEEAGEGETIGKAKLVRKFVRAEMFDMTFTPEFKYGEVRTDWNPTGEAILLLRALDVFAYDAAYWWERKLILDVLKELSVDFGGLDLTLYGVSPNIVRDAMMAVLEGRVEMAHIEGWNSRDAMQETEENK